MKKQLEKVKRAFLENLVVDYLIYCSRCGILLDVYRGRVIGLNVESQKEYIDFVEYVYKTYGYKPKEVSDRVVSIIKKQDESFQEFINDLSSTIGGK